MEHPARDYTQGLLAWKKWSIAGALFLGGYVLYYLTQDEHGFVLELLNHVGLFLAAVVAVHFIYELLIKRNDQAAMRREVSESVIATINAFMPSFQKWGFQGFQEDPDFREIFGRLRSGDELLWLDTYAPSRAVVATNIAAALERGARVRMLAIAPDADTAKLRAREIRQPGFTEQSFLDDLASFIEVVRAIRQPAGRASLELRLYHDLPCVPMYIQKRGGVPIRGYTSYFLSHASENFAHTRWAFADDGMLKHFAAYFETKWADAKPCAPRHARKEATA